VLVKVGTTLDLEGGRRAGVLHLLAVWPENEPRHPCGFRVTPWPGSSATAGVQRGKEAPLPGAIVAEVPIPWSDEEMLETVAHFWEALDFTDGIDFTDEDTLSSSVTTAYLRWLDDLGEEIDEDYDAGSPPSALAIGARFGSLVNASALAGCLSSDPDDEEVEMAEFIARALREQGADGLSDASRRALRVNGLAHFMWRNGPIETIHAGGAGGLGALSDGDMMRTNALVCSIVNDELSFTDDLLADLVRLRRGVLDPQRLWPTGETLWGLCEGYIGELSQSINHSISRRSRRLDEAMPRPVHRCPNPLAEDENLYEIEERVVEDQRIRCDSF
jgi:hypothetical protein